jgi:AcrR family transcriptional regulator
MKRGSEGGVMGDSSDEPGRGGNGAGTKERILAAADELLVGAGYDGLSMRDVAARAGVNKASVFYHFNSKAELIERVLDRYYKTHLAALEGAFDGGGTLHERMHRLVDAYLDFIEENQRYARLIQQHVAGGQADSSLVQRNLEPLYTWVERALSEVAPATGPLAARHIFVTFSGIVINYFTYAPVLGSVWGSDPLSPAGLAERREHVHWIVGALLDRLVAERAA